jgi:hypothetical protein
MFSALPASRRQPFPSLPALTGLSSPVSAGNSVPSASEFPLTPSGDGACAPTRECSCLLSKKTQKSSSFFSSACALFKKAYFFNSFEINLLRALLQNTGGGTPCASQLFPAFSTPSKLPMHTRARNPIRLYGLPHNSLYTPGTGQYASTAPLFALDHRPPTAVKSSLSLHRSHFPASLWGRHDRT